MFDGLDISDSSKDKESDYEDELTDGSDNDITMKMLSVMMMLI